MRQIASAILFGTSAIAAAWMVAEKRIGEAALLGMMATMFTAWILAQRND